MILMTGKKSSSLYETASGNLKIQTYGASTVCDQNEF
jgi:hypothetical protein